MKKLIALLLALAMVLGLVACGNNAPATDTPGADTPAADAPASDDGWHHLTIMGQVDQEFWDSRDNQPVWAAFQEKLAEAKIDLEVIPITEEQYKTVLQTTLTTGVDMPDLVNLHQMDKATAIQLGESGVLLDVLPLLEQYDPDGTIDNVVTNTLDNMWGGGVTESGACYWAPFGMTVKFADGEGFVSSRVPVIRVDWLKNLGLDMPTNLEEYKAALRAFRDQDANGNGVKDEVMLAFTKDNDQSPFERWGPMFGLPADHIMVDTSDNTVKSPWLMKDQLVEYFSFFQEMAAEGILDLDAINQGSEYVLQQSSLNVVSSKLGWAITDMYDGEVKEYGGAYRGVYPFAVEGGDRYIHAAGVTTETYRLGITSACDDIEGAIKLLEILYSDDFTNMTSNGLEGVSYEMVDGEMVNIDYGDGLVFGSREYWLQGRIRGGELWLPLLGGIQLSTGENFYTFIDNMSWPYEDYVKDYVKTGNGYNYYFSTGDFLAAQTAEEAAREVEIMNTLKDYMDEVAIKLATGEYSLDDIDSYIQTMKDMGLEEMVAIRQAQHDRYIGK